MKKERVLLVNPPAPFLIQERVFPSLAVIYVATVMRKDGYNADVLDLAGDRDYQNTMKSVAKDYDIYAFTSTSPQFFFTTKLLDALKSENPDAFTVIGGPHASVVASLRRKMNILGQGLDDPNFAPLERFDLIIEGEGEVGYKEMFKKEGGKWRQGGIVKNLDDIPIPDRTLFDIDSYDYKIDGLKATNIITQRGCPFNCYFCSKETEMYKRTRTHTPERVLKEMDFLHNTFGFDAFMWYDDELNVHHERLLEITKLLEKRPYKHRGFLKADLLLKHPEVVESLAKAGFVELCTGVESGSDRLLKEYIGKGTSYATNLEVAELIKKNGMRFKAFIILGHPTETEEDVMKTKEWLLEARPDDFDITIHQACVGSPAYNNAVRTDKMDGYAWSHRDGLFFNKVDYSKEVAFYKGIPGEYSSFVRTTSLSGAELVALRDSMEKEVREKFGLPSRKMG